MQIVGYVFLVLLFWFSWNVIHELMHVFAVGRFKKLSSWKIYPYPHMVGTKFYFARATWEYAEDSFLKPGHVAIIYLAPRLPGLIAGLMFVFSFMFSGTLQVAWIIFSAFGLIDFAWGSIGRNKTSDLRIASTALKVSPWVFRIGGFVLFLLLVTTGITFLFLF